MKENGVPYSMKESCELMYYGSDKNILKCWNGCIDENAEDCSSDKRGESAIPIDFDWCRVDGVVNYKGS
jgi:hypothetical protein